jgi:hypothetical protein
MAAPPSAPPQPPAGGGALSSFRATLPAVRDPLHPAAGEMPPLPTNIVGAGYITGRATDRGQHSLEHPVTVHILWDDGVIDDREGWAVAWTREHVRVHYWARGSERWSWFEARDVQRRG